MHDETAKWIEKAEGDFEGAILLSRKGSKRLGHLICFSRQQCAEKYLKAFLVEHNIPFPKTHDLTLRLLPLCESKDPEFKILFSLLEILDPYSVEFRYPGEEIIISEVKPAIEATKKIRKYIREKLSLEKQGKLL